MATLRKTATPAVFLGLAAVAFTMSVRAAEAPRTPEAQQVALQQRARAEADQIARRALTLWRALHYCGLDAQAKERLLDEMAGTLNGLSRRQMSEIIERITAASTAESGPPEQEMGRAYQRHREVLKALLQLRARCDAVKSLEQASDRLEKAAQDQLELHLAASRMIARWRTATGKKRSERPRDVAVELRRQGHTQSDLGQDAGVVLKQIAELKPGLPDEHQSRVQEALDAAGKLQVVERIGRAGLALSEVPDRPERDSLAEVFTLQRQAATDLARLGRDVLAPLDKLSALQEVYQRADQALHQLEQISKDTVALAAAESGGEAGQDAADRVARVAYTVRGLVHPLQPHAPELAAKTAPADGELAAAEQLLRSGDPSSAATAERRAAEILAAVLKELDRLIHETEMEMTEPDAAAAAQDVQKALELTLAAKDQSAKAANPQTAPDDANQAANRSAEFNQAARNAIAQAGPVMPKDMQGPLSQADQHLSNAGGQLASGSPGAAQQAQGQAAQILGGLLKDLETMVADQQGGQPDGTPMPDTPPEGSPDGKDPQAGDESPQGKDAAPSEGAKPMPGQMPGMMPAPGKSPMSKRAVDPHLSNAPSKLGRKDEDRQGYIQLQPRERELVNQAQRQKLPPEYAPMIQQYHVNIARGKPAVTPVAPLPGRKP